MRPRGNSIRPSRKDKPGVSREDLFGVSKKDNPIRKAENSPEDKSGGSKENLSETRREIPDSPMGYMHIPVLLDEVIKGLDIRSYGIYVDGTAGGGGHSLAIAKRLGPGGRLICIDRDQEAVSACQKRLFCYFDRVSVVKGNFRNTADILESFGIDFIDGMVLDLGVSSHQFDDPKRGFSYRFDAPLDMRMDQASSFSAFDVVNNYSESKLFQIIRDYGEEDFAKRIARYIVEAREEKPIETTFELVDIIKAAIPAKMRRKKHPARKTFQALRIEVNGELVILSDALDEIVDILKPGGRLAVISFHSLEHRIVKQRFKEFENQAIGKVITKKAIKAQGKELILNPRAKSALLRVFEKG